jgi:hypothetical protein
MHGPLAKNFASPRSARVRLLAWLPVVVVLLAACGNGRSY